MSVIYVIFEEDYQSNIPIGYCFYKENAEAKLAEFKKEQEKLKVDWADWEHKMLISIGNPIERNGGIVYGDPGIKARLEYYKHTPTPPIGNVSMNGNLYIQEVKGLECLD